MKPMLSATCEDIHTLKYPVLASPKLDGIRCLIVGGVALSRNFKNIPNESIRSTLDHDGLSGLDGELIVGDPKAADCYRKTNSGVMSHSGAPNWTFWVFDDFTRPDLPFADRLAAVKARVAGIGNRRVRVVPHVRKTTPEELHEYETQHIIAGYEGIMVRSLDGRYKHGRATAREASLLKIKRFTDGDARIVDFEEQMHNANELTKDELGRAKRSGHKANMVPKGTLGALKVVDTQTGVDFDIGTGFTDAERQEIWNSRAAWKGRLVKYKSMAVGVKERPRHPVYLGPRADI